MGEKYRRVVLLFVILSLLAACGNRGSPKKPPLAKAGVLDLRTWDLQRDGAVPLAGEWELYWNVLLTPDAFSGETPPERTGFITVPKAWNGYKVQGKKISGRGYATYRLLLLCSEIIAPAALKFNTISTAYMVYANGKIVSRVGSVGKTLETMTPQYRPHVADITIEKIRQVEIIIQVSNFYHRMGGIRDPILFGVEDTIHSLRETNLILNIFLIGAILIMGLYHAGLYGLRREEKSTLYFAVFCFLITLYALLGDEKFFVLLFPGAGWVFSYTLILFSVYLAVPVFAMFIYSLFPMEFPKLVLRICQALGIIFSGTALFRSLNSRLPLDLVYQIFTLVVSIYAFHIFILAFVRRREGAGVFLFGYLIFFLTVVNDLLRDNRIIFSSSLIPLGLFIFIFSQSFLLSMRFSKALTTVKVQRKELEQEIEERGRVDRALKESEKKYRQIFENATEGIFQSTPDGRLLTLNPAAVKMFGYDSAEEAIKSITNVAEQLYVDPSQREKFLKAISECGFVNNFEISSYRKDGSIIEVALNAHVVRDEVGNIRYFEGIVEDITEKKKNMELRIAKEAAEAATKAKSDFLASISH
ncbi:MAG: 7TM diverse intracellular signaling domain-containing protein, partial [Spirochaetota bacterium]